MAEDLAQHHGPIGQLFSQENYIESELRLSEDQLQFYEENGFVAGVPILNDEQVDELRDELSELFDPNHDGNDLWYEYHSNESGDENQVLFHALGAWRVRTRLHDILWHPKFTVPASQLLGGAVRFWHDQLFCKPSHHGGVVAWHQDYSYWTRTQPMAHLTCWIGLDDSTTENGCLQFIPGSHRWPLLPITGLANDMDDIQTVLTDEQKSQFQPVAAELKKGEASFHHPLMVHGSYENRSDRPRRAIVLNVILDGVKSASDDSVLAGVPAIPAGEKMAGTFFPLLYDPAKSSS